MELFEARDHFIIQDKDNALWCNRFDGSLNARRASDICTAWNPICLGRVHGVIGKLKTHPDADDWRLVLIRDMVSVGFLPGKKEVFKITKVIMVPLTLESPKDIDIELCHTHHSGISKPQQISRGGNDSQQKSLQKTWNSIKSAAGNVKPKKLPFKLPPLGDIGGTQGQRDLKEREKFERRILEEWNRMFNDSNSFYVCPSGDLTSSIQRQHSVTPAPDSPAWAEADDRFFWNKYMLQDLLEAKTELANHWVQPVIQGYIEIAMFSMGLPEDEFVASTEHLNERQQQTADILYKVMLISRRSRHRAGTRYKRRGVDEKGNCANYVETEQILEFSGHVVSFVQVRGSVPLYWSQTGIKYKPPPRIERGEKENGDAFEKHMEMEVELYRRVAVINLVDQTGKEKVMADSFLQYALSYNCPELTYVAFDFHEYCRGMRFENVNILIETIYDLIKEMRYCWVDPSGMICDQRAVFRVNCIDCLDRTNIVQSGIARMVLVIQCRKLGLLPPDEELPRSSRLLYQQMWANNGDAISRQYAGTAALKGDYTKKKKVPTATLR